MTLASDTGFTIDKLLPMPVDAIESPVADELCALRTCIEVTLLIAEARVNVAFATVPLANTLRFRPERTQV